MSETVPNFVNVLSNVCCRLHCRFCFARYPKANIWNVSEFGAIRNPTAVVLFHFCTVLGVYINTMTTTCRNIYIFYRFPFSPLKDPYPDPFFHRIRIWVTQNDRNRTHIIPLQDTSQANLEQLQRYISYNSLKGRRLVGFIIRQEFVN